jgi:tetratricopeptide (TPR) repeat protein
VCLTHPHQLLARPTVVIMSAPAAIESMRIYVHSVPNVDFPAWADHTYVFVCGVGSASPSVRKLKQSFKEDLFRAHFSKDVVKLPIMTQGVVRDADGRQLADDTIVAEALQDREDVFFELKGTPTPPPAAKPAAAASSSSSSSSTPATTASPTIQFQSGDGEAITLNRSDLASMGPQAQLMFQQLSVARDLQGKGQLKKARDIYQQVLKTLPSEKDKSASSNDSIQSCRQICHQQLGVIFLFNRFYDLARPHFEAAVKIVTSSTTGVNGEVVKNIGRVPQVELSQLISLVGQCWFGVGDFSEATPCFERALKLLTPKGEESKDAKILASIQDTKVWLARALYRGSTSERSQALSMFEAIIAKNEHHIAALTYYAQIAIECGKKGEVIPYLLRALVASQAAGPQPPKGAASYEAAIHHKGKKPQPSMDIDPQLLELVQTLLTDLVSMPGGVATLLSELHGASSNHAALTFLAQTVKDQGGVGPAIEIYRRALEVCELAPRPRSNLLLNLIHTLELDYQFQEAFDLIKNYLADHPDLTVGSLKVSQFYEAIENVTNVYDIHLRTGTAVGVPAYCEIGRIFDEVS